MLFRWLCAVSRNDLLGNTLCPVMFSGCTIWERGAVFSFANAGRAKPTNPDTHLAWPPPPPPSSRLPGKYHNLQLGPTRTRSRSSGSVFYLTLIKVWMQFEALCHQREQNQWSSNDWIPVMWHIVHKAAGHLDEGLFMFINPLFNLEDPTEMQHLFCLLMVNMGREEMKGFI